MSNLLKQLESVVNRIDFNELSNIVTGWNFKKGGCCGELAKYLIKQLEQSGFCFTSYYDMLDERDKKGINYLYEKRTVAVNGLPHENIHLFNTNMKFIGIIDIPMHIYEQGEPDKKSFKFWIKPEFKEFKEENIKFKCFEPMDPITYMNTYYHLYIA